MTTKKKKAARKTPGYGEIIKTNRERMNMTQRELGFQIGCTDGYVAHLEREVKLPSLDLCMAMSSVFEFSLARQQAFLKAVDAARAERSTRRIGRRSSALRGDLQRGAGAIHRGKSETLDAAQIERDLDADPQLRAAYRNLKTALGDKRRRDTVLNVLRVFAESGDASR